ncbi:MAG: VOC family protein [Planctomycetota bacterium]
MIEGGYATIFVSDLDRAVRFYTDTLDLALQFRAGDHWAEIDAGSGLVLGLHPAGEHNPPPGSHGAISVGLNVTQPLESVVERLKEQGVQFRGSIVEDEGVRLAFFGDPDGNDLYLCEVRPP